ncbi:NIPSNAP family protein [Micromonospora sp. NPDC048830]|uniref:NIPSNAP family protein n=1 Tax=Micromonospora sp. NPDC048830 TaxID=3364257 RepID=UPI0037212D7B
MIAEFRTYKCAAADLDRLAARLRAAAVPVLADLGAQVHGPWTRTRTGEGEMFYVVHWHDTAHMERGWLQFARDSRWIEAKRSPIPVTISRDVWSV